MRAFRVWGVGFKDFGWRVQGLGLGSLRFRVYSRLRSTTVSIQQMAAYHAGDVKTFRSGAAIAGLARAQDCAGILPSLCHKFLQYAADNHVSTRDVKICRDDLYSLFGDEGEKTINRNGFEQLIDNVRMENQPNTIQEPENLHSLGRSLVGSRTDPLLSPVFR